MLDKRIDLLVVIFVAVVLLFCGVITCGGTIRQKHKRRFRKRHGVASEELTSSEREEKMLVDSGFGDREVAPPSPEDFLPVVSAPTLSHTVHVQRA